ncbi:nuclear transport factor 2 family protein [Maribacter sp.]|nr:nuclear transport factor 2 family protein [Maribacter sp.]
MNIKRLFRIGILIFLISGTAFSQSDENEVREVINAFFNSMETKDSITFNNLFIENAYAYSIRQRGDSTLIRNSILKASTSKNTFKERLREEEVTIHINQNIAAVWAPYDFWIDEKHSHCGYEVFTLLKNGTEWKIASLTYSVERASCNN